MVDWIFAFAVIAIRDCGKSLVWINCADLEAIIINLGTFAWQKVYINWTRQSYLDKEFSISFHHVNCNFYFGANCFRNYTHPIPIILYRVIFFSI